MYDELRILFKVMFLCERQLFGEWYHAEFGLTFTYSRNVSLMDCEMSYR